MYLVDIYYTLLYDDCMTRVIEPSVGTVLVKLAVSEHGDIPVPEKNHDSITNGTILAVHPDDKEKYGDLVGRTGYWRLYKDDLRIDARVGAEKLCLIEIKDILGSSYEDTSSRD